MVRNLTAHSADSSVTLTWDPPVSDGGSPITNYAITYRGLHVDQSGTGSTTNTTFTVTGLQNYQSYKFILTAVNAVGFSGNVNVIAYATPVPGSPTITSAVAFNLGVSLTWAQPATSIFQTGYIIETSQNGIDWTVAKTVPFYPLTATISSANGVPLHIRISAVNQAGTGAPSAPVVVTPLGPPDAPTDLVVYPGNSSASLTWVAPTVDGGTKVTGYQLQTTDNSSAANVNNNAKWIDVPTTGTQLSATATGLTNTTTSYFRVRAINSQGAGAWSATASTIPFLLTVHATVPVVGTLDNSTITPGSLVRVSATKLPSGTRLTVSVSPQSVVLGSVIVGPDGQAIIVVTIPNQLSLGPHELVSTVIGAGPVPVSASTPFTLGTSNITPGTPTPTPQAPANANAAKSSSTELAATGLSVAIPAGVAGLLLLLGVGNLVGKRRRRA